MDTPTVGRSGSSISWRSALARLVVLIGWAGLLAVAGPLVSPPSAGADAGANAPIWLPFRVPMKVGCVNTNCAGPYHGYWAVDFETVDARGGAPVYAAGSGRVRIVTRGTGCGPDGTPANVLAIEHGGGVESVYVHLADFAVADGAQVSPNTVIGHVGSTGYTSPCPDYHLHYEKRINGVSVNPGPLYGCQGWKLVNYPGALGYTDWNAIPPQDTAGGPLPASARVAFSDGTSCRAPAYGSPIAVGRDGTNRLQLLTVNPGDQLYQNGQSRAGSSSITAVTPVVGSLHSVAAQANRDGRLEQFGVSFTDAIYHRWQSASGGWSGWVPLPGALRSVALGLDSAGRVVAFGTNAAGSVYSAHQITPGVSTWSAWALTDGSLSTIAADSDADGRLELVGANATGAIYHRWQTSPGGGWSAWTQLAGQLRSVALARDGAGRVQLIGTNSVDQIYTSQQLTPGSSRWSGWLHPVGSLRDVATEADADGRLEQFGVNAAGATYHRWQGQVGGGWSGWVPLALILRP